MVQTEAVALFYILLRSQLDRPQLPLDRRVEITGFRVRGSERAETAVVFPVAQLAGAGKTPTSHPLQIIAEQLTPGRIGHSNPGCVLFEVYRGIRHSTVAVTQGAS